MSLHLQIQIAPLSSLPNKNGTFFSQNNTLGEENEQHEENSRCICNQVLGISPLDFHPWNGHCNRKLHPGNPAMELPDFPIIKQIETFHWQLKLPNGQPLGEATMMNCDSQWIPMAIRFQNKRWAPKVNPGWWYKIANGQLSCGLFKTFGEPSPTTPLRMKVQQAVLMLALGHGWSVGRILIGTFLASSSFFCWPVQVQTVLASARLAAACHSTTTDMNVIVYICIYIYMYISIYPYTHASTLVLQTHLSTCSTCRNVHQMCV